MSRTATFLSKLSTEGKSIAILLFLAVVPFEEDPGGSV